MLRRKIFKESVRLFVFLFLVGTVFVAGIKAEVLSVTGDISVVSDYVWRGQLCDDDSSFQTGLYLSGYDLSLSLWTSYPLDGEDSVNCEEVDYSLEYSKSISNLSFALGYIYYDFPNAGSLFATELYGKVGLDVIASPSITYYYDFTDKDNALSYISLDASYDIDSLSVGGHYGLYSDDRGSDLLVSMSYGISLPNSSLVPNVNYSIPFGDLHDTQDSKFYAGIRFEFEL